MRDGFCHRLLQIDSRSAGPQCPFSLPFFLRIRIQARVRLPLAWRSLSTGTVIGRNSLKKQQEVVNYAVPFIGLLLIEVKPPAPCSPRLCGAACSPRGVSAGGLEAEGSHGRGCPWLRAGRRARALPCRRGVRLGIAAGTRPALPPGGLGTA